MAVKGDRRGGKNVPCGERCTKQPWGFVAAKAGAIMLCARPQVQLETWNGTAARPSTGSTVYVLKTPDQALVDEGGSSFVQKLLPRLTLALYDRDEVLKNPTARCGDGL